MDSINERLSAIEHRIGYVEANLAVLTGRIAEQEQRIASIEAWRLNQRDAAKRLLDQYAPHRSAVQRLVAWARRNRE